MCIFLGLIALFLKHRGPKVQLSLFFIDISCVDSRDCQKNILCVNEVVEKRCVI